MANTLTPSPCSDATRAALQPSLQTLLYGLVMLAGECNQTALFAQGPKSSSVRSFANVLHHAVEKSAWAIGAHMAALGVDVDMRVDGASDNNPFAGSFSSGETSAENLGEQLLARCRQIAMMVRTARDVVVDDPADMQLETMLELEQVALAVSRAGGQLAQALR